jgi:hypothetical protein
MAGRPGTDAGTDHFYVAFSPEREDPGRTDIERHDVPKVVGGLGPMAGELAAALYGSIFRRTVSVSTPAVAEKTKLLENIYRCVNIALVNEIKLLSLRMGIDFWEVIDGAKTKPFGFQAFYPGPGSEAIASLSIPTISHGRPRNSTSKRGSLSLWVRSTCRCPTMLLVLSPRPSILAGSP